jgi:hypothetical protein
MAEHLGTDTRRLSGIILLLLFCIWAFGSHDWADAESNATTGVIGAFHTSNQGDTWIASDFKGQVNRPLLIHLNLSPYPPPAGTFYTAIVDVLESPQGAKPKIVPGVPDISVWCPKSGTYRLRIRANLIEKSSCALANARILKEQEIRLIITP